MIIEHKKIKYTKIILVFIAVLVFLFDSYNLFLGYQLIGKKSSGFGISSPHMVFSPSGYKTWTGYQDKIEVNNRIIGINDIKIFNIKQFQEIINSKPDNTSIKYTFIKNNKIQNTFIKTMIFTRRMIFETYGLVFFVAFFYLIISLFIIYSYRPNDDKIKCLLLFTLLFSASCSSFYESDFSHKLYIFTYFIQVFTVSTLLQLGLYINEKNLKQKYFY